MAYSNALGPSRKLTVLGVSNIISDIFDAAIATGWELSKVVIDESEQLGPRDIGLTERISALSKNTSPPKVIELVNYTPEVGHWHILGPTSPLREGLLKRVATIPGINFCNIIHPSASVSSLAKIGSGCFIGAMTCISSGVILGDHVFVNRHVGIGHDSQIGSFTRIQPGVQIAGLSKIGRQCSIGMGASILERLIIGDSVTIAAASTVTRDLPSDVSVAGSPARAIQIQN